MSPIPLYYIYTPRYEAFHKLLFDSLTHYPSIFEAKPIFLTQEDFQKTLKSPDGSYTSWFLKIDCILDALHQLPENSYFIFSDADIYCFPNKDMESLFHVYMNNSIDFVAMQESTHDASVNFGFCLVRVCDATRKLFIHTKQYESTTMSDQRIVNVSLQTFEGSLAFFPPTLVASMSTIEDILQNSIRSALQLSKVMIFQPLPNGDEPPRKKIIAKLSQYYACNVPIEDYKEFFPDSIVLDECSSLGRNFSNLYQHEPLQ